MDVIPRQTLAVGIGGNIAAQVVLDSRARMCRLRAAWLLLSCVGSQ
jgi:hypothetical protein